MIHQFVEDFRSDSFTTLDASIGLKNLDDGWSFNLLGTNLTDETSADFSGPPASAGIVPPNVRVESPSRFRTVMIQARKDF